MKLLMLIHRLPCPADRGSKLRAAADLRHLAHRHDVWCAGFLDASPVGREARLARQSLAEWRSICRAVEAVPLRRCLAGVRAGLSLIEGATCTEGYFRSRRLERRVLRWADEIGFDAVLAFSSSMAPLALRVPARRRVLDLDDFDSRKWDEYADRAAWPASRLYRTEARRLQRREREWIAAFDAGVVVSRREADLLDDPGLRRRLHVIEPTLSLEIPPSPPLTLSNSSACANHAEGESGRRGEGEITDRDAVHLPTDPIVGFVGAMDYAPNVDAACWFAESIWPRVRRKCPDASWWVVGRSPTRAVRRLDDGRSIRVTGAVPGVEPYFERMRVHVAPLRMARGVQMKVLAAMAAGRPSVVTPCVAEGLDAEPDRDLVVADLPASFADAVADLLTNERRAARIARAGRDFVLNRSRSEQGLHRLEALLAGGSS